MRRVESFASGLGPPAEHERRSGCTRLGGDAQFCASRHPRARRAPPAKKNKQQPAIENTPSARRRHHRHHHSHSAYALPSPRQWTTHRSHMKKSKHPDRRAPDAAPTNAARRHRYSVRLTTMHASVRQAPTAQKQLSAQCKRPLPLMKIGTMDSPPTTRTQLPTAMMTMQKEMERATATATASSSTASRRSTKAT